MREARATRSWLRLGLGAAGGGGASGAGAPAAAWQGFLVSPGVVGGGGQASELQGAMGNRFRGSNRVEDGREGRRRGSGARAR
jgi:hypothetical protein